MADPLKDTALCTALDKLLSIVRESHSSRDAVLVVRRDGRTELGLVSIDGTHYENFRKFDQAESGEWTETVLRVFGRSEKKEGA